MPRYIGAYRGGVRPSAPTTVYRTCALSLPCHSEPVTDVTGVGIRPPPFSCLRRGTFALGGKSTQKRRSNLRFENPLRAFTQHLSRWCSPRERCAVEISPKCCIVSASLSAAAFALKSRAVWFFVSWQDCLSNSGQRPPPTFAALRQRRDLIIAHSPGVRFPKGRGRTGRKPSERKIRKESNPPEAKKRGSGRTEPSAPTHVYRKPMRYLSGRMWASAPTKSPASPCVIHSAR